MKTVFIDEYMFFTSMHWNMMYQLSTYGSSLIILPIFLAVPFALVSKCSCLYMKEVCCIFCEKWVICDIIQYKRQFIYMDLYFCSYICNIAQIILQISTGAIAANVRLNMWKLHHSSIAMMLCACDSGGVHTPNVLFFSFFFMLENA